MKASSGISTRVRSVIAAFASVLLVGSGLVITAAPAAAADITAVQTITKTADTDNATVAPGEPFLYSFAVTCGSSVGGVTGCGNATIIDLLPPNIEFVAMGPFPAGAPGTASVTQVGGRDQVTITFTDPVQITGDPATPEVPGLPFGSFTVSMQVRLAADAPWEISGAELTNTADLTSDNADPKQSSVPVTPAVPRQLDSTPSKSFAPAENFATPGLPTTLTLSAANATNGAVDELVVQDPAGTPATDASNPFFYLAFTGFGTVTPPAGADEVVAEVFSAADQTWHVVYTGAGPPVYPAPGGDIPALDDVYGVRFTFTDTTGDRIARDATVTADVQLAQRDNVDGLPETTLTNTVTSSVRVDSDTANSDPAQATYRIVPYGLQVAAGKSFDKADIRVNETSIVRLTGTNTGTAPLETLTITEPGAGTPDTLAGDLEFVGIGDDGAGGGIQWPADADGATITYQYEDGTDSGALTAAATDTLPAVPAGAPRVVGFTVTFTATAPATIVPSAEARVPFTVEYTGPTPPPEQPVTFPNETTVTGSAGGQDATDSAQSTLTVYGDQIAVEVGKSLSPAQGWLIPGQQVTAQIPAKVSEFPATTVNPTQVVVEDSIVTSPVWWNLYDVTGFPQLGIPDNATLTIEYTTDGTTWQSLAGPLSAPPQYQDVAIPAGVDPATIQGFRFIYDADPGASFAPGTTFQPNATFTTRDTTRDGDVPIEDVPTNAVNGQGEDVVRTANCAGAGATLDAEDLVAPDATTDPCPTHDLVPIDGDGDGPDLFDKALSPQLVTERTQAGVTGQLRWSTGGLTGVVQQSVTETGSTGGAPATTATLPTSYLNAFDIVTLPALTKTNDPLLAFDRLVSVELFDHTTGTWTAVGSGDWDGPTSGDTVFPGYTLTSAERATTTGVRYLFEESPNRAAALTPGDLSQPAVGSGVASSIDRRTIPITFQLRDVLRVDGTTPVLATDVYNVAPQVGLVRNTGASTACFTDFAADGTCADPLTSTDAADTTILNGTATITTGKTWTGGPIGIPDPSTTAPQDFPTTRATLSVVNNGPQLVDSMVLRDPAPGVAVAGTAFDSFDLVGIVSVTPPPGATATQVVLVYADGTNSPPMTVAEATAMGAAALADVVGIQAASDGRIGTGTSAGRLQVQLDLRLRVTLRSTGAAVTAATVPNSVYGAISDPSVEPAGSCAASPAVAPPAGTVIGCSTATTEITGTLLRTVDAGKTFGPTSQYEDQDGDITMTLSGRIGGDARSTQLVLQDDTPAFWNAYGFAGLSGGFATATPSNRVLIEVLHGATYTVGAGNTLTSADGTWITVSNLSGDTWMSAAQARAALPAGAQGTLVTLAGPTPAITYGQVQGLRVTFQRVAPADINDPAAEPLLFENPAGPTLSAATLVNRRDALLTTGAVPTDLAGTTAAPGTPAAGTYPNTVTATVSGAPGSGGPVSSDASASFRFLHRPTSAQLTKTPAGLEQPGVPFTVTLSITNDGQWPIIDPVITDTLPVGGVVPGQPDLVFPPGVDPAAPGTYTYALSGGTAPPSFTPLPTASADVDVALDPAAGDPTRLQFSFPAGSALGVGQTYTVSFRMQIRVGAIANETFTNTLTVDGERQFDTCNAQGPAADTCATTAELQTTPVASLAMVQQVRATDDELGVLSATTTACTPADADLRGFYRFPCTPVTKPGGIDEWELTYTNTGTYPLDIVDSIVYFPHVGPSGIDIDSGQTSQWTPELVPGSLQAVALDNPNANIVLYYTTAPRESICTELLNPGSFCPTGAWQFLEPTTDFSTITAVYGAAEFDVAGDALQPGGRYRISFQTVAPDVAPTPAIDPKTWNSVKTGGWYTPSAGGPQTQLAPFESPVVGAALATGSVSVEKSLSGPAAGEDWVPATFTGALACTSNGTPVPAESLPPVPPLTPGTPVTVTGVPWGAECTFVEDDAGSAVTLDPATVVANRPPATAEVIGVRNDYQYASLVVRKAAFAATGFNIPTQFAFTVQCTFNGEIVLDTSFTLDAGQSQTFDDLPARARCVVQETDDRGAGLTIPLVDVTDPTVPPTTDDDTLTVVIPELTPDSTTSGTQNEVGYINLFGVGGITIRKDFAGAAAAQFGEDKTFTMNVVCTFDGETLVDTTVDLDAAGGWTAAVPGIVIGSECTVTEPDLQGADAVTMTPSDPADPSTAVVIVDTDADVDVTATNWYLTGSVEVTKTFDGDGAQKFGTADYTLELTCVRDGIDVVIPGGTERTVSASSATAEWNALPTGADCTLAETDAGGADPTAILDENGDVLVPDASTGYTFTVVTDPTLLSADDQTQPPLGVRNTFDFAEVSVIKTVTTDAVDQAGDPVPFGPFEVTLSCEFNGIPVSALEPMTQAIADGDTVTWTELPAGAACTVTESDTAGAGSTSLTVTQGGLIDTSVAGTSVVLDPLPPVAAANQTTVAIDNTFPTTALTISKELAGTGAAAVSRTFPVDVVCTLTDPSHPDGYPVRDDTFEIGGASSLTATVDLLPVGTSCTVTETDAGGADATAVVARTADGTRIAQASGGALTVIAADTDIEVVITNTFVAPLPPTGGEISWAVPAIGGGLVLVGIVILLVRRRRRAD
ncbi:DUF5979 domain-containing protein [Microbacterium sp. W1N]|uniref:DUF5979 domain-containing protein n=1 Tax=Microbacterium festucae TaxID=2977531 RepID=UPI0021BEF1A5|nr:DUF5979 domain-containing protein [Microbacterium festucae]MCT9819016.1 DUF5979 domain-containing protein [Microbacterium festucae]